MLEKHITLARVDGGPDAGFSLEPEEFKDFVQQSRAAFRALGKVDYSNTDSNNCHRSLYVVEKIKKGEVITNQKVKSIRPGLGLEPKYYDQVIGKVASRDLEFATPLQWNDIK